MSTEKKTNKRLRVDEAEVINFPEEALGAAGEAKFFPFEELPLDIRADLAGFLPYREARAPVSQSFREAVGSAATWGCGQQTGDGHGCLDGHGETAVGVGRKSKVDESTDRLLGACRDYCLATPVCSAWMANLLSSIARFSSVRLHFAKGEALVVPVPDPLIVNLRATQPLPALAATYDAAKELWELRLPSGELFEDTGGRFFLHQPQGRLSRHLAGVPKGQGLYSVVLPVGDRLLRLLVRSGRAEAGAVDLTRASLFADTADTAHLFCHVIRDLKRANPNDVQLETDLVVEPRTGHAITGLEFLDREGRAVPPRARWSLQPYSPTRTPYQSTGLVELILVF